VGRVGGRPVEERRQRPRRGHPRPGDGEAALRATSIIEAPRARPHARARKVGTAHIAGRLAHEPDRAPNAPEPPAHAALDWRGVGRWRRGYGGDGDGVPALTCADARGKEQQYGDEEDAMAQHGRSSVRRTRGPAGAASESAGAGGAAAGARDQYDGRRRAGARRGRGGGAGAGRPLPRSSRASSPRSSRASSPRSSASARTSGASAKRRSRAATQPSCGSSSCAPSSSASREGAREPSRAGGRLAGAGRMT
jgi:hypothetical protein